MRPGMVVSIRVNPKDCMAVIDILEAAGVSVTGMSFPQMVSLAFSSLIATAKLADQIPDRTGFEYMEMMQPYTTGQRTARKLDIANTIHMVGSRIQAPALQQPMRKMQAPEPVAPVTEEEVTMGTKELRQQFTSLLQKKDVAEDNPNVLWSDTDESEYQRLYKLIYPDG